MKDDDAIDRILSPPSFYEALDAIDMLKSEILKRKCRVNMGERYTSLTPLTIELVNKIEKLEEIFLREEK